MSLLRKILLGVALATGVTGSMLVDPPRAEAAPQLAYGHRFDSKVDAEAVRVKFYPRTVFGPTHLEYFNPGSGLGWYICI